MQPKYTITVVFSSFGVLVVLTLACTIGCNQAPPPTPDVKPLPGVIVQVAAPRSGPIGELIQRHGQIWAERSGGEVQVVESGQTADVVLFAPAEMGRLVGSLAPLSLSPERGQDQYEFSKFLRHQLERNMDWGGAFHAVPVLGEGIVFAYRADLLGDPKHQSALGQIYLQQFHRPVPANGPSTWQEVAAMAEYFATLPEFRHASLPPLPASASELDRDFHLVAASIARRAINLERSASLSDKAKTALYFSYQFDATTGAPLIDQAGFAEAIRLMQRLQKCRPPEPTAQPVEAFRKGHAVFTVITLADIPRLQAANCAVRDKFGICRIPGSTVVFDLEAGKLVPATDGDGNRMSYHGHSGWMGGVAARSANAAAARDFLLFLTSPETSAEIACETSWGGGPTRMAHLDHKINWHNYGLSSARTQQLVTALESYYRPTLLNPAHCLRLADQDTHVNALTHRVRAGLAANTPAEETLRAVAADWRALTAGKDPMDRLRQYRNSQGLK